MTLEKSVRVLSWAQEDDGVVWFNDYDEDHPRDEFQVQMPAAVWTDFGEPCQITLTIEPGDRLNVGMAQQPDRRPHSRACGFAQHAHGPACSADCPTCVSLSVGQGARPRMGEMHHPGSGPPR